MTFCSMSDDFVFQCPVCRARQTLRDTCRRCKADLRLVVQAYRRVDYLRAQHEAALAKGDHKRAQALSAELAWLLPGR